jgi:hypothetical protein
MIYVNGLQLKVTHNLWEALIHLRTIQDLDVRVGPNWWFDSICINQANDAERGHQVSMMRKIFESATLVVAWLGQRWMAARDSCEG